MAHVTATASELYFGAERVVNNGDSHIDFEFLQSGAGTNVGTNGCAPAGGGTFTGHRSQGDLLLAVDFTTGGTLGGIQLYSWSCGTAAVTGTVCDPTGKKGSPAYATASSNAVQFDVNAPSVTGSVNPVACGGWVCRNAAGGAVTSVDTNEFMEGGINLDQAGLSKGCILPSCPTPVPRRASPRS